MTRQGTPLRVYQEGSVYEDALSELEQQVMERADLERAGRDGAAIEVDAMDRGPLYQYALARRTDAVAQLKVLATGDLSDTAGMGAAQAVVRDFLRVSNWARGIIDEAAQAEDHIKEVYGDDHQE